jgi:hypothetical protein
LQLSANCQETLVFDFHDAWKQQCPSVRQILEVTPGWKQSWALLKARKAFANMLCQFDILASALANALKLFANACQEIPKGARNNRMHILCHCKMGRNRSPTIWLALAVGVLGLEWKVALKSLKDHDREPDEGKAWQIVKYLQKG